MKRQREVFAVIVSLILGFFIVRLSSASLDAPPAGSERDAPVQAEIPAALAGSCAPSVANIVEKTLPSVVNISSTRTLQDQNAAAGAPDLRRFFRALPPSPFEHGEKRETSLGSAVIVSADGLLLTNNHVVDRADDVEVTLSDGRTFSAEAIGSDPQSDLAVLRIRNSPQDLVPITFGDPSSLRLGDVVIAIGNPFGVGQTVTMGIVSAKGRADLGIVDYEDFIQTDAAINPGNSGGALVSLDGKLVGINTAILSRTGGYQGIGFAIPADMVRAILDELLERGRVVRGWLGVGLQDLTPSSARALGVGERHGNTGGVIVAEVGEDSPAARAGLKPQDVLLSLDGEAVASAGKLRNRIAMRGAGAEVALKLLRDRKVIDLTVKLDRLPEREPAEVSEVIGGATPTSLGRSRA